MSGTEVLQDQNIVEIVYYSSDDNIASVSPGKQKLPIGASDSEVDNCTTYYINVTGEFIGRAELCADGVSSSNTVVSQKCMDVSVIRESRVIDKAFTYSVVALVAIIYVNMGAALDIKTVKETMKRPIGPVIGFVSQFAIMPLVMHNG